MLMVIDMDLMHAPTVDCIPRYGPAAEALTLHGLLLLLLGRTALGALHTVHGRRS